MAGEPEEIYLAFRHTGVDERILTGLYREEQVYLPLGELLDVLRLPHERPGGELRLEGEHPDGERRFAVDFSTPSAHVGGEEIGFTADDFILREQEYFVRPGRLQELLQLDFSIDLGSLSLSLDSQHTLPVERLAERRRERRRMDDYLPQTEHHPLLYDRDRRLLDGGFLDYNVTGQADPDQAGLSFTSSLGVEILGGDLQGNLSGNLGTGQPQSFRTTNMRWRYVLRESAWFSSFKAGQIRPQAGITRRNITGLQITNEPVTPRVLFDDYVIEGTTTPDSEVELLMSNRLIDYQQADEQGDYRFTIPLTYGSTQLSKQIFAPDGSTEIIDQRLRVPFRFLPPGEFSYHFSAGRLDQALQPGLFDSHTGQSELGYGLSDRFTARVGAEYLEGIHERLPQFYGGVSYRLGIHHLINLDAVPQRFYRLETSAVYPGSQSWQLNYTYHVDDGFYNTRGSRHDVQASLFLPYTLAGISQNIRLGTTSSVFAGRDAEHRVRADWSMRVARMNLRMRYRDLLTTREGEISSSDARLAPSITYPMLRHQGIPLLLRGLHTRVQADYSLQRNRLERLEMQLSRSVMGSGRLRIRGGRNLARGTTHFEVGFTYDFASTRSTSTARMRENTPSLRQSLRGSIGYDPARQSLGWSNRQQVGRSGASVRLFIDHSGSGKYDPEEDELIRDNAVRVQGARGRTRMVDGVTRIERLQPYRRLNLEIDKNRLSNPLLVPDESEFSFVTDPNRYKQIDIPFYMTGVIEGQIDRMQDDRETTRRPAAGVRLLIEGIDVDHEQTLRTFSDGSFYAVEIPPGRYRAQVDPEQLSRLGAESDPQELTFEVASTPAGDLVSGLEIVIIEEP